MKTLAILGLPTLSAVLAALDALLSLSAQAMYGVLALGLLITAYLTIRDRLRQQKIDAEAAEYVARREHTPF